MGNNVSGVSHIAGALDSYVSELGADIVYEKSLGQSRLLKAVRARHRNGPVVIKMFIKHDPSFSLRTYIRRLKADRELLVGLPNVYNYQSFLETERAGYVIRQWLANSLYDRISTRPFLSTIEKKWIAYQLVSAMKEVKEKKVSHGDIRSENILVTSWNWVYITDFASYKPVYLPEDDPTNYSYFFDISGRRTCYIAPERFFSSSEKEKMKTEEQHTVTEAMDVFGVGCVIAELFLEGKDTFSLSQLFKYRAGELDISAHLSAIDDDNVKRLILRMIALNPADRPSFADVLDSARDVAFPEAFYSFLYTYVMSINETSTHTVFARTASAQARFGGISATGTTDGANIGGAIGPESWGMLPSDSDHRIERTWSEFDSIEPILLAGEPIEHTVTRLPHPSKVSLTSRPIQDILPVEVHIPNRSTQWSDESGPRRNAAADDGLAVIVLSLVCANIRNCSRPSSKVKALDVLLALAPFLTDESKLDRLVPYVIELLRDDAALVRASAIRTLTQVVMLVSAISASNASLFPEYVLPNVKYLTRDPDVMVRVVFAQCIVPLAETAIQFLEMSQAVKAHGTVKSKEAKELNATFEEESYDVRLRDLQLEIEEQIVELLVDQRSVVKRAVLQNSSGLCVFFGRQKTNDVLLSHMITYLNDRDWLLRDAFFTSIVNVAAHVGPRSLEEYILPLMIQSLSDVEETVVAKVLASLTSLAELGLFHKLRIWELVSAATGFLCHPNVWIRQGAAAFISSSAKHLAATDVWCIVYPYLRPMLRSDIQSIGERSLLSTIKPPLSRPIFDAAVVWAMRARDTVFWDPEIYHGPKIKAAKDAADGQKDKPSRGKTPLSEEDDAELSRLQQLGMVPGDEAKILHLREYILKLAAATQSFSSRPPPELPGIELTNQGQGNTVGLQSLGIVPQTVFLNGREPSASAPSSRKTDSTRRLSLNEKRPAVPSSHRTSRGGNDAYGDLRRRLAQIDSSVISLTTPTTGTESRVPQSVASTGVSEGDTLAHPSPHPPNNSRPPSSIADTEPPQDTPGRTQRLSSPSADSIASNTHPFPTGVRPTRRGLQVGDGRKAAPAIGTVNTEATATGVLEAAVKLRADLGVEEPSGRASPVSFGGTARKENRTPFPVPAPTTYDGQEPAIANVLEHVYQDNFRDGLHDFGPRITNGPPRRRQPVRSSIASRADQTANNRGLEANVIASLTSHGSCINGIVVSPDHIFFVSCSDDKTVKVWDTARLERNVTSKPRHSYTQHHSRVTCVCMIEESHCFASAAEDGSLHVVRVHVAVAGSLPKYGKLQTVREHRLDHPGEFITSMHHFNSDGASSLIYTTSLGSIVVLELRSMRILQTMTSPIAHGAITASCMDKGHAWFVTGTQSGMMTLWDLRFSLKVRSWGVGAGRGGPSSAASATGFRPTAVHRIALYPTWNKRTRIIVAIAPTAFKPSSSSPTSPSEPTAAQMIIEVWDISRVTLVESFVIDESGGKDIAPATGEGDGFTADQLQFTSTPSNEGTSAADAIAAFVRARKAAQKASLSPAPLPSAGSGLNPTIVEQDTSDTRTIRGHDEREDDADSGILHDPDFEPPEIVAARSARDVRALLAGINFGSIASPSAPFFPSTIRRSTGGGDGGFSPSSATMVSEERRGFMLTGSVDRKITFWDLSGNVERSTVLSGLDVGAEKPIFRTERDAATGAAMNVESWNSTSSTRPSQRTNMISTHQQQLHKSHQDCVTALALLDSPFRGCIVSGDRSGTIKVLRVDVE